MALQTNNLYSLQLDLQKRTATQTDLTVRVAVLLYLRLFYCLRFFKYLINKPIPKMTTTIPIGNAAFLVI